MKKIILIVLLAQNLYSQTTISNKVLIPFRDKNSWGLSDTLGKIIVKPFAKEISDFIITNDGKFISRYVVKTNKTYYVIDKNKKVFLPEINTYDSIRLNKYQPDHFLVYRKGKVGMYHKNKEIVPCLYDDVELTANQSYEVKKGKLYGLINSLGTTVIPIEYTRIHSSWDDEDEKNPKFVWVAKGVLVEKKFYDTKIIRKGDQEPPMLMAGVKTVAAENESEINYNEIEKRLKQKYDFVKVNRYSNFASVGKNGKYGIVDIRNEEETIRPVYDEIVNPFQYDHDVIVYKVKKDGKYGLVKPGNISMLNCEFDDITQNNILEKDGKKGYITLNTIYPYIQPKYKTIKTIGGIEVNDRWQFGLFEVTTEKSKGWVGENGVEFFRD